MGKGKVKVFVTESGNTLTSKQQFLDDIHNKIKMADKADCDVILGFCPVISRVGTDIEAALRAFTDGFSKYIIVVVLHHTFDKEHVVPDNAKYTQERKKTYLVNCLFHEDKGLLKNCDLNTRAINQTKKYLEEIKAKKKQEKKEKKKEEKAKKKQEKKEKKKEEKKARL